MSINKDVAISQDRRFFDILGIVKHAQADLINDILLHIAVPNDAGHLIGALAHVSREKFSQTPRLGDVRHFYARMFFVLQSSLPHVHEMNP